MPKGIPSQKYSGEFKQKVIETMRREHSSAVSAANVPALLCIDQMASGEVDDSAYALQERFRFRFGNQELGRGRYAGLKIKVDACTLC